MELITKDFSLFRPFFSKLPVLCIFLNNCTSLIVLFVHCWKILKVSFPFYKGKQGHYRLVTANFYLFFLWCLWSKDLIYVKWKKGKLNVCRGSGVALYPSPLETLRSEGSGKLQEAIIVSFALICCRTMSDLKRVGGVTNCGVHSDGVYLCKK